MTSSNGNQKALSPRQQEVYDLHHQGLKNTEIGERLGIAAGTVSNALVQALIRKGERSASQSGDTDPTHHAQAMITQLEGEIVTHEDAIDTLRGKVSQWQTILDALQGDDAVTHDGEDAVTT